MQQPLPPPNQFSQTNSGVTHEELIEAIIDEKWNELVKDISTIIEWKNSAEQRLIEMNEMINTLKNDFNTLHKGILGKVGEYDKHIMDVGAEIQAMEKVFAKVLPLFTENVSKLSQITNDLEQKK
jgi:prefoldin subunit 5